MSILTLQHICKSFDGIKAVNDVSLKIPKGSITSIIGPNGAGKTSLFNVINGFIRQDSGSILFNDLQIDTLSASTRARHGIGRLWQDIRLFNNMTVLENLLVGNNSDYCEQFYKVFFRRKKILNTEMEVEKNAIDILGDFKLYEKRNSLVQSLSYGQQKLVALGRLLIGEAEILLIDEPTSGVHPLMINEILATIKKIAEKGKTVLMIEHNIPKAFSISDAVHVMDDGKIEITGTPSEVMNNPALTHIYTGI